MQAPCLQCVVLMVCFSVPGCLVVELRHLLSLVPGKHQMYAVNRVKMLSVLIYMLLATLETVSSCCWILAEARH